MSADLFGHQRLEPYQERVVAEMQQLSTRLEALMTFLDSPPFQQLEIMDRQLLLVQAMHMTNYRAVLAERVSRFRGEQG